MDTSSDTNVATVTKFSANSKTIYRSTLKFDTNPEDYKYLYVLTMLLGNLTQLT